MEMKREIEWARGEKLGSGGFGFVSKAISRRHQEIGRRLPPVMAVKSAKVSESKSLSKEKELLDIFEGCPSILRCYGDDLTTEEGQQLYNILLEYASGGCLIDRISAASGERKALPENLVGHYTKSILTALVHIHRLGYVHCDIKPHNVLLFKQTHDHEDKDDPLEDAKLADFGSCIRLANGSDGDFRGTAFYAAPESISRQEYTPKSDVWSLGCTVLHMLTGKSPWTFDKQMEATDVLLKIGCSNDIPEIPTTKTISKEAKDFLRRCFVKDPTSRWTADMLLHHPFVIKIAARNRRRRHHHHQQHHHRHLHLSCFHIPKSASIHAY